MGVHAGTHETLGGDSKQNKKIFLLQTKYFGHPKSGNTPKFQFWGNWNFKQNLKKKKKYSSNFYNSIFIFMNCELFSSLQQQKNPESKWNIDGF